MSHDTVGHSSVQAWSAGPIFPAVIAVVERYSPRVNLGGPCPGCAWCGDVVVSYELTIGAFVEEYATREDAEAVARSVCQRGRINAARYAELRARTLVT